MRHRVDQMIKAMTFGAGVVGLVLYVVFHFV